MASNTVLKTPRISDFPETDPLAELSRIMGLAREEAAANSSEMDFEIDLEQELMGEFMQDERTAIPVAAASPIQDEADFAPLEAEFDDAFADMLADSVDEAVGQAEPVEPEAPSVDEQVDLTAQEATLAHDLVDLDAAFEGFDLAADPDMAEQPDAEAAVLFDDATLTAAQDEPAVAQDEPFFNDDDFSALDTPVAEPVSNAPAAVFSSVAAAPPAAAMSIEDELRILLGRVNTPVMRTPMAANDGGRADARASYVASPAPQAVEAPMAAAAAAPATPQAVEGAADGVEMDAMDVQFEEFDPTDAFDEPAEPEAAVEDLDAERHDEMPAQAESVAQDDAQTADEMPSFDDFAFDASEFDDVELATALAERLATDEDLNAAAEAEYAKHIAKEELAALNSHLPEEAADDDVDMAIDLEAELAAFSDDEIEPMKPDTSGRPAETASSALRPLAFPGERAAHTAPAEHEPAPAFDWRKRYAEMKTQAAAPVAPAPEEPKAAEPDPFAALAALASQPPAVRNFSRTNPVALGAEPAERAPARPSPPAPADRSLGSRSDEISPALAAWRSQSAARVTPAAVPPAAAPTHPHQYTPVPRTVSMPAPAPRAEAAPSPVRPGVAPAAAGLAASAFAARPAAQQAAAAPHFAPQAPLPAGDDFPDLSSLLDDVNLVPEIETVEISDQAVALADELDIPDLIRDEPPATPVAFDDLDADFADAFQQLSFAPAPKAAPTAFRPVSQQPDERGAYYVDQAPEPARDSYAGQTAARGAPQDDYDDQLAGFDPAASRQTYVEEEPGFDEDLYVAQEEPRRSKPGRGMLVAAAMASVAIIGGIGAYAFMGGSTGDGVPVLVRADPSPVKVKPETPGGVVVPNQDGQVYDEVRGQPSAAPTQGQLVSGAEEPIVTPVPQVVPPVIDQAAQESDEVADQIAQAAANPVAAAPVASALPGVETPQVKSEERVTAEESAQNSGQAPEVAAVTPRRVRTMIVRADGTLVPREDPPAASAETTGTTMQTMPSGADPATLAAAQPATQIPSAVPGAQDEVSILPSESAAPQVDAPAAGDVIVPMPRPARTAAPPAAEPVRQAAVAAAPAPVSAPVAQPAAPVAQQASAPAATAPIAAGTWSVQIASQPTREGAQSSYESLAGRYGNVLGGKGVNIVQAEVAGKGTMWRVRVPSASRNDANILCAKLKTAGGSCFVTQ